MKTITVETSQLSGAALDWAVAKAKGEEFSVSGGIVLLHVKNGDVSFGVRYTPSTSWAQGGRIIEENHISLVCDFQNAGYGNPPEEWGAYVELYVYYENWDDEGRAFGATPLIAAMRAIVAASLGNKVEVPAELVEVGE